MPDTEPTTPDPPVTRAPGSKPRFGYDASGQEIQPPATGLLIDAETGQAGIPPPPPTAAPATKATASKSSSSS